MPARRCDDPPAVRGPPLRAASISRADHHPHFASTHRCTQMTAEFVTFLSRSSDTCDAHTLCAYRGHRNNVPDSTPFSPH
jgi:hypothetical protein